MTGDDGLPARLEARPALDRRELAGDLRLAAATLDHAVRAVRARLEAEQHQPWGVADPLTAQDVNGRYLLLDALTAQVQALSALAFLEGRG